MTHRAERQAAAVLAVVEDEVKPSHVVHEGEEREREEDPADRVPRLRARDHVADRGIRKERDEDDAVVRRPRIVRDEAERDDDREQDEHERRRRLPCAFADGHARNLGQRRYGIVTP